MHTLAEAQRALAAVDLQQGLALSEVHTRLEQGLRLQDTGQRILAFYLTEMEERRLYQETGHSSTTQFAEDRLDLDRRRTAELIAVGRKLLTLPAIDRAFCAQQIGWSKVLHLAKVATAAHDDAWLERARELSCRALALEVRLSKAGEAPRKPGERKGLHEVRFKLAADVGVLTHRKWDLAKQKLGAERGRPVDDAECIDVLAELFLNLEEDGTVAGRTRVDASLYRIVLRSESEDPCDALLVDTELGPIPIAGEACIRCDGECVHTTADPHRTLGEAVDRKTPAALRKRVLARDGGACRCCGSRHRLMVHHIRYRSKGGRTLALNLITLCATCHALVHEDLLILEGTHADRIRFLDGTGRALHAPGEHVEPAALMPLTPPETLAEPEAPNVRRTTDPGAPTTRRTTDPGAPTTRRTVAKSPAEAFAGIVGQDALLGRLETVAAGSRARGRAFPHTLFVGPPGTGKTTLARGIAARFGARLVEAIGPLLQDSQAFLALLAPMGAGDMLFLDEIHAMPRGVLETLYQAMTEGPAFTVLAATTEDGELPQALRTRFGLREALGFYDREDLATLVRHVARAEDYVLDAGAATRLAESARGTPREALRLLDRVLDEAACAERSAVTPTEVEAALERLGYDRNGLEPAEQRYLAVLRQSPDPIPLTRLARMLGASARTLVQHLEPFLFRRGLVRMTARGRIAGHPPRLLEA